MIWIFIAAFAAGFVAFPLTVGHFILRPRCIEQGRKQAHEEFVSHLMLMHGEITDELTTVEGKFFSHTEQGNYQ